MEVVQRCLYLVLEGITTVLTEFNLKNCSLPLWDSDWDSGGQGAKIMLNSVYSPCGISWSEKPCLLCPSSWPKCRSLPISAYLVLALFLWGASGFNKGAPNWDCWGCRGCRCHLQLFCFRIHSYWQNLGIYQCWYMPESSKLGESWSKMAPGLFLLKEIKWLPKLNWDLLNREWDKWFSLISMAVSCPWFDLEYLLLGGKCWRSFHG